MGKTERGLSPSLFFIFLFDSLNFFAMKSEDWREREGRKEGRVGRIKGGSDEECRKRESRRSLL